MTANELDSTLGIAPGETPETAEDGVAGLAATIAERILGCTFPNTYHIPKDTPVEVLNVLSRHPEEDVRAGV